MAGGKHLAAVGVLLCTWSCAPGTALDDLGGQVLFYPWVHGSSLAAEDVAQIREERVRGLREIEDFSGTLPEWVARSEPLDHIRIGPSDFVYGNHFFVYYLAALKRPAVSLQLEIRIVRIDPSGEEFRDHQEFIDAGIDRRAHSGGLLFSMYDLPAGEHRLRFEFLDGDRVRARGELQVDYRPGPALPTSP